MTVLDLMLPSSKHVGRHNHRLLEPPSFVSAKRDYMSKRIDVVSEYDYSNIESILLDGIVLTNPLIDYIHGVLPDETSSGEEKPAI